MIKVRVPCDRNGRNQVQGNWHFATRLRKVLGLLRETETLLVTLPRGDFKDRGMLGFFSEFIKKVAKEYETAERATK